MNTEAFDNNELASLSRSNSHSRRFPKSSVRILKRWIISNAQNPHPTDEQKRELQEQTGLTPRQINVWFSNARRRGIHKTAPKPTVPGSGPSRSISVPDMGRLGKWHSMNPFERWRNSPPEQEPASLSAIADAVAGFDNYTEGLQFPRQEAFHLRSSSVPRPLSEASYESMSSFWTTDSDDSAHSGQSELISNHSNVSLESLGQRHRSRRRRSLGKNPAFARKMQADEPSRIFQCTFCTDRFKTKYDWTRHEGTLHLVLEKWNCSPEGPTYQDDAEDFRRCSFCDQKDPPDTHRETHHYDSCVEKPQSERSFRRKDHLRQHLKLIHGVQDAPHSMKHWKTTFTNVQCRCGFCGEQFKLWSDRNDHIAEHFRDGVKMIDWKGDRGFAPEVALFVENAMPPYLIGEESMAMEPFSASKAKQGNVTEINRGLGQRTIFEDLSTLLSEHVLNALRDGRLVTDESVRKQARLIMFGDDDAWNQTPADNAEWLRLFKSGLGLGESGTLAPNDQGMATGQNSVSLGKGLSPYQLPSPASSNAAFGQPISRHPSTPQFHNVALMEASGVSPTIGLAYPMPSALQTSGNLEDTRQLHDHGGLDPGSDVELSFGNLSQIQSRSRSGGEDIDDVLAEIGVMGPNPYAATSHPSTNLNVSHCHNTHVTAGFPHPLYESGPSAMEPDDMDFSMELGLEHETGALGNLRRVQTHH